MVLWTPTWIGLRTTAVNYLPSVSSNVFEKCLEKFLQCVWKVLYFYYYKIFRKCYHFREWNLGSTKSVFPGWWSHKFVFRIHYLLFISRQDLGFCAKSSMQRKLLKKTLQFNNPLAHCSRRINLTVNYGDMWLWELKGVGCK